VSYRPYTTMEKLIEVERLIELGRQTRDDRGSPDYRRQEIFKAIAEDLRGRLEGVPSLALHELERRLVSVDRAKADQMPIGGPMLGVAQELTARWPVVKQALEKFGQDTGESV